MEKPRHCPFCGNKAILVESNPDENKDGRTWWKIACNGEPSGLSLNCIGQFINLWHVTPEDAVTAWNKRAVFGIDYGRSPPKPPHDNPKA